MRLSQYRVVFLCIGIIAMSSLGCGQEDLDVTSNGMSAATNVLFEEGSDRANRHDNSFLVGNQINPIEAALDADQIWIRELHGSKGGELRTAYAFINGYVERITYERVGELNIWQGDIAILDDDILGESRPEFYSCVYKNKLWPNKTVHYAIGNVYNRDVIINAIKHWQNKTDMNFVQTELLPWKNMILFKKSDVSSSSVGMQGGIQTINLASWATTGVVIHEIGHAVGHQHEHCRSDRDNYVTIHWNNIESGKDHNFEKVDSSKNWDVAGFDFNSIMLYSSYAFSKNNSPTITRKDGSVFGVQQSYLSSNDVRGHIRLYGTWEYEGVQCYLHKNQVAGSLAFHRYYHTSGQHFYTTNWGELGNGGNGWIYEGVQGYAFGHQAAGTVPLYRYVANHEHFYTTNWSELGNGKNGYSFEGIQCYVYPINKSGTSALYRYYYSRENRHFYTTNWSELGPGG